MKTVPGAQALTSTINRKQRYVVLGIRVDFESAEKETMHNFFKLHIYSNSQQFVKRNYCCINHYFVHF